jgi:predicted DCC family thiol-disulfide oxidoreductase YuxK
MHWASAPAEGLLDLILFDGDCVLCSHSAVWVHQRDTGRRFRFVAIQSEAGCALAERFGVSPDDPQTNVVIVGGRAYFKFDAILAVLATLPGRHALSLLRVLPRAMRDWLYDRVARNRYRLFGRRDACLAPDAAMQARMIERVEDLAVA